MLRCKRRYNAIANLGEYANAPKKRKIEGKKILGLQGGDLNEDRGKENVRLQFFTSF